MAICQRLRAAREFLELTQEGCARQIGIEKGTLANLEYGRAPLRYELGLRFCRNLVISGEWLATGEFNALGEVAITKNVKPDKETGWKSLETIFKRQAVDLLSEPICHQIRPGTLFSDAYDQFLATRYAELVKESFYTPRIIFTEDDKPDLGVNLLKVFIERWMKILSNEALRLKKDGWLIQRSFLRSIIEADTLIFKRFMGFKTPESSGPQYDFLRTIANSTDCPIGPLHGIPAVIPESHRNHYSDKINSPAKSSSLGSRV